MTIEGNVEADESVLIEPGAIVSVREARIGSRTLIRSGARIEGNYVELGTECYLDHGAWIGGGSCRDERAKLVAGDWLHMGWNSQINIARGVEIGHEVGIGIETKIFTHGAYLPADKGFPVQWSSVKIGNRVWLPNAWVNPGVTIGDNVVVAAGSLINKDLPSGCLAGGVPAKVIKENCYPTELSLEEKSQLIARIISDAHLAAEAKTDARNRILICDAVFDLDERTIEGPASYESEVLKNQLRRNGIRFRYIVRGNEYVPWEEYFSNRPSSR